MRILKWIPLLYSILIFGQEDSISPIEPKIEVDSLWYKNTQNNFSSGDEFILLGYHDFESSIMGNFGSVLIPFWWKSGSSIEQKIGDRIIEANNLYPVYTSVYKENFPHTKIIYSPTYSDGQRLNFIHKVKYTYGSFIIDYDRLVSEGNLVHEKHQNTRFNFQGSYTHPKIAYTSKWRINTFKNSSPLKIPSSTLDPFSPRISLTVLSILKPFIGLPSIDTIISLGLIPAREAGVPSIGDTTTI